MNRVLSSAVVVAGLVLTLGGAVSWGGPPPNPTPSDSAANTAGGTKALVHNLTGNANTAFGAAALKFNLHGDFNTAVGGEALLSNTDGEHNTAIGTLALSSNTVGVRNVAVGVGTLHNNTNGFDNSAIGYLALASNTEGYYNTADGFYTLFNNSVGTLNTALGYYALYNSRGSRNLALGFNAGIHLRNGDRNIYLGSTGASAESDTMRLGSVQTHTFIAGIVGTPMGGAQVTINNQGQLGILASSARYKRDIQAMGARSQGLHQLRPVTFRYKQDTQGVRQYGLIAEEVAKVYPELVVRGADGKVESVQYHELIPMLLNEVQHQQQEIVELKAQAQQVAELKAQNAALAARLERLEQGPARTATLATR